MTAIAEVMDTEIEFSDIVFIDLFPAISSGRIDLAMSSITVTDERLESFDFSQPYYNSILATMDDLTNGIVEGYVTDIPAALYYTKTIPELEVVERIPTGEQYALMFRRENPLRDDRIESTPIGEPNNPLSQTQTSVTKMRCPPTERIFPAALGVNKVPMSDRPPDRKSDRPTHHIIESIEGLYFKPSKI